VAGEEGVGVQRELHAGWVRDGLAQQRHHSVCGVAATRTDMTRAVEHLQEEMGYSFECGSKVSENFGFPPTKTSQ